ncbi:hypothetical protein UT300012_23870 [Paraclostridium bifermentans]
MAGRPRPTKYNRKTKFSHRQPEETEVVDTYDEPKESVPRPRNTDNTVSSPRDKRPPRRTKEKPKSEGKGLGGFLNFSKKDKSQNDRTQDKLKNKPKRQKPQRGRKAEPEVAEEVRPIEPVKQAPQKESKVQSYLGGEFLEIPETVEEDMYLKVLLKTVRKRNTLGAITLIPLDKVSMEIEEMVSEYSYRRGGLDDMLTEDEYGFEETVPSTQTRTRKKEGKINVL